MHCIGDVNKVFEELDRNILVRLIVLRREFDRDAQHVETEHRHPAGAIGLFEHPPFAQRRAAIEDADVVETEKAAFKKIIALRILAIGPPGEVEQQLLEGFFQKVEIGGAGQAAFDTKDAMRRPGLNRS